MKKMKFFFLTILLTSTFWMSPYQTSASSVSITDVSVANGTKGDGVILSITFSNSGSGVRVPIYAQIDSNDYRIFDKYIYTRMCLARAGGSTCNIIIQGIYAYTNTPAGSTKGYMALNIGDYRLNSLSYDVGGVVKDYYAYKSFRIDYSSTDNTVFALGFFDNYWDGMISSQFGLTTAQFFDQVYNTHPIISDSLGTGPLSQLTGIKFQTQTLSWSPDRNAVDGTNPSVASIWRDALDQAFSTSVKGYVGSRWTATAQISYLNYGFDVISGHGNALRIDPGHYMGQSIVNQNLFITAFDSQATGTLFKQMAYKMLLHETIHLYAMDDPDNVKGKHSNPYLTGAEAANSRYIMSYSEPSSTLKISQTTLNRIDNTRGKFSGRSYYLAQNPHYTTNSAYNIKPYVSSYSRYNDLEIHYDTNTSTNHQVYGPGGYVKSKNSVSGFYFGQVLQVGIKPYHGEITIRGFFSLSDTFNENLQPNRRYLKTYALTGVSVGSDFGYGGSIQKQALILSDYAVAGTIYHISRSIYGLTDGVGYSIVIGRYDAWTSDWQLKVQSNGVVIYGDVLF